MFSHEFALEELLSVQEKKELSIVLLSFDLLCVFRGLLHYVLHASYFISVIVHPLQNLQLNHLGLKTKDNGFQSC